MQDGFNPYQQWLGLDAEQTDPDFYQLLRIDRDETSPEVIRGAADRAIAKVRSFRPGEHAAEWAQLLDALAEAKKCLTDPSQRSQYDQSLQKKSAQRKREPRSSGSPSSTKARLVPAGATKIKLSPSAPQTTTQKIVQGEMPVTPLKPTKPSETQGENAHSADPMAPVSFDEPQRGIQKPAGRVPTPSETVDPDYQQHPGSPSRGVPKVPPSPGSVAPSGNVHVATATGTPAHPATGYANQSAVPATADPMAPLYWGPTVPAHEAPIAPNSADPSTAAFGDPMSPIQADPMFPIYAVPMAPIHGDPMSPHYGDPVSPTHRDAETQAFPGPMQATYATPTTTGFGGSASVGGTGVPMGRPVDPNSPGGHYGVARPVPRSGSSAEPALSIAGGKKSATRMAAERAKWPLGSLILLVLLGGSVVVTCGILYRMYGPTAAGPMDWLVVNGPRNPPSRGEPDPTVPMDAAADTRDATTKVPTLRSPNQVIQEPDVFQEPDAIAPPIDSPPAAMPKVESQPKVNSTAELPPETQPPLVTPNSPATPASPGPQPVPSIKPESQPMPPPEPQPTPQQLMQLSQSLTAARAALKARDLAAADAQLAKAESLAKLPEHQAKVARLKELSHYVHEFWAAVKEGMQNLRGGEDLQINNTVVAIVEASPQHLVIRVAGQNRRYDPATLPGGLVMAIADKSLDPSDPYSRVIKGALYAVEKDDETYQDARRLWQEAAAGGADVTDLLTALDDNYNFQ